MWSDKAFNWLGGAFLFISGYALGGKSENKNRSLDCQQESLGLDLPPRAFKIKILLTLLLSVHYQ